MLFEKTWTFLFYGYKLKKYFFKKFTTVIGNLHFKIKFINRFVKIYIYTHNTMLMYQ